MNFTPKCTEEITPKSDIIPKSSDEITPKSDITPKSSEEQVQGQILLLIKNNPFITQKNIANILNKKQDTIKYNMQKMSKQGIIKHIGSSRIGYWKVNK